jgi:gliding motility-associated-like protein
VQAMTDKGCIGKDSVTVFMTNGLVPNAFSPNGDGQNDIFRFYAANDLISLKSFRIFDRWGKEMFYTQEMADGWNGTYKGEACENGVYFYFIEYAIGSKAYTYKGDVTLLR